MKFIKSILKDWLPPVIVRKVQKLRNVGIRFQGDFTTWQEAAAKSKGYNADEILHKVLQATLKVKAGEAAYERDSVLFDKNDYIWPITAMLMLAAVKNNGSLKVLDFGGALGSSYFQNMYFLSSLKNIQWSIIEQKHYVEAGVKYIQDESINFFTTVDSYLSNNKPDVILLSSVLQYVEDFDALLKQINNINASFIIIDKTAFTDEVKHRFCVQSVPKEIYKATYPMRLISKSHLINSLSKWRVMVETQSAEGFVTSDSNIKMNFSGIIFSKI